MILLQKFPPFEKTLKNGMKQQKKFAHNMPFYVLVDEQLIPITKVKKIYVPAKDEMVSSNVEKHFTQAQLNHLSSIRTPLNIVTDAKAYMNEFNAFDIAIKAAELKGFESGQTELLALRQSEIEAIELRGFESGQTEIMDAQPALLATEYERGKADLLAEQAMAEPETQNPPE